MRQIILIGLLSLTACGSNGSGSNQALSGGTGPNTPAFPRALLIVDPLSTGLVQSLSGFDVTVRQADVFRPQAPYADVESQIDGWMSQADYDVVIIAMGAYQATLGYQPRSYSQSDARTLMVLKLQGLSAKTIFVAQPTGFGSQVCQSNVVDAALCDGLSFGQAAFPGMLGTSQATQLGYQYMADQIVAAYQAL